MSDLTQDPGSGQGRDRTDDLVQPFVIERPDLRGRYIRFGAMINDLLTRHAYPDPVAALLGETVALACLLSSTLKFDGIFTLQARGDGPVSLLVADVTSEGNVRGYARFDGDRLPEGSDASHRSVPDLLGEGHLVFTVDTGSEHDRYQGIVALTGSSLAECFRHYFLQSEQIDVGLKLAVGREGDGGPWRACGLLLQRLPSQQSIERGVDHDEDWRRAMILMGSATDAELLDPALMPNTMLFRLFHEEGVRVFDPAAYQAQCRCSRDRVARTLATFPADQIESLKEDDDHIKVVCEFCNTAYIFQDADLAALHHDTA